ncbi:MAG: MCE family protein [Actinomycetota bacterium]
MTRFIRPLASIVTLLLVAGTLGLGYNAIRGDNGTYRVTAFFEKAIGLFPNSDVTILGVAVGKVTSVEPQGQTVKVEMNISDEHKVPVDAFAQIVPISVISDRYVQFAPVYAGGAALEDGAVLGVQDTQIPAELDDVFKQLKKLLDAIEPGEEGEPGALGELIVQLNDALAEREEDLRGTLVSGAQLTGTLADAREDLSGLLVNLDDLFGRLATRADSLGTLNRNFALVMTALAQSREDLEGTLANLASATGELGSLVREHRGRLGRDLRLAARITSTVLENRASVEESLRWLPTIGKGVAAAYHGGEIDAVDVRDNLISGRCDEFEELPEEVQDLLEEVIDELCGTQEPRGRSERDQVAPPPAPETEPQLDCTKSVKKVRRQIRRIAKMEEISPDLQDEIVDPLKKKLRKLSRKCEELGGAITDPDQLLQDIFDEIGDTPELTDELDELTGDLVGSAAGESAAPAPSVGLLERVGSWFGGLLDFVGWSG